MFRTLKGKFSIVYLFLVIMIAVLGITSVFSFYVLSKSIDGLMVDNYKSINSASNMLDALEGQNVNVLNSIQNNQSAVGDFYSYSSQFYKWFHIVSNNVTETGEIDYVKKIESNYLSYLETFSILQNISALKEKNWQQSITTQTFFHFITS